jgi:predicted RNase H-like nuclease (RuvC/YqgF family)
LEGAMSHRDAEELAAEIAYMQDDPSFHPRYNPKGKKDTSDLEARIERLEFRNEKLHKFNSKLIDEVRKLRRQLKTVVDEYRNKGAL